MKKWYLSLLSCVGLSFATAQTVFLAEHFDYPADSALTNHGWYVHSGTSGTILVNDGGLTLSQTNYKGNGVGNAARINNNGYDINRPFSSDATSGSVYASFLLKVNKVAPVTSSGYMFHLGQYQTPTTPDYTKLSTAFRARTHVLQGTDSTKFKLGLSFNSNVAGGSTAEMNVGETYLVVLKYTFYTGSNNDDSVSLFVFADGDDIKTEPAVPTLGPFGSTITAGDLSSVQCVALRQYNASQDYVIDGIIAQDAWDLVPATQKTTRTVKFSVDMKNETISANGVHVAGNFQGWSPGGTTLTQESGTSIYSTYAEVDENNVVEYKFINDNNWGAGEEKIPAISQKGHSNNGESNGNRWFHSGAGNDTLVLPTFVFSGSAPDGQYAVRLAVDLQKEASVSTDGVHIAGNIQKAAGFPEWNPSATQMTNLFNSNKIYEVILCVANGNYAYKFVNGNAWGKDESVPSACATDNNRAISVSGADVEAAKVCFGSCDACPTAAIPKFKATFQIDMAKECNFEKVDIAGGRINGWAGGDFLTDDDKDGVYTITLELDSGVEIAHKVRKIDASGNVNWEGGSDRKYFVHNDTTFAVRCFGLDEPCSGSKIMTADVWFKVDMSNEIPQDTVWLMGSFTSPAWQAGAIAMLPSPDNADIYEVIVEMCSEYFEYKFVNAIMSSSENGETFPDSTDRACLKDNGLGSFNRHYTRTNSDAVTLEYVYNSCAAPQSGNITNISSEMRIAPNPASGMFTVSLGSRTIEKVIVMSLDGRSVRSVNPANNRADVNVFGLTGVYLVQITDVDGNIATQKVVLQ